MIRHRNSTRYSATPGSDTDALQTDVMRFMSILGLCLMAVFALVQSMPQAETDRSRPEPGLEKLHQDIALQQERAQRLQVDLNRLTAQVRKAHDRNASAQRALSSAQKQLTLLVDQTEQARSDRERLNVELEDLRGQLAQGRHELAGIQQAAEQKAHSLQALQRRLREEQKNLDDISQRATALKLTPAPPHDSPATEKRPSPLSGSKNQGFTLRFASVEALERLVAAGTVSLYAMADKQAWRLSLADGSPVFAPDVFPGWFHQMAPSTVPVAYVRTLETSVGQPPPAPLVWGVQLPAATKQGIASLTRGQTGGDLVIDADGRVTLEPG